MRVLIGGYLAKPLVVPLTTMISAAAPVEFEAIGEWLSESNEIPTNYPILPEPPFFFSRRRIGAAGSGPGNTTKPTTAAFPSLRKLILSRCKSLAYDVAFHLDAKIRRKHYRAIESRFDLIHLHSVFASISSRRFSIIGSQKPLVVTLWGSDVLRKNDPVIMARQQLLLEQATLITCSTPEFREVVLAKYGRHLASKIRETYFSINNETVDQIVALDRDTARRGLAAKHNIPADATVVCIGHNASPANQHLEAIRSVGAQPAELKRSLFLVIPMTYCQTDKQHIDRVREEMRSQGLTGVVLTEFMSDNELTELRKATDVFIYAAISDVFSATISQGLIAQQAVITGSWLPNRARKRAGCVFWEVDEVAEVGEKLTELCEDWENVRKAVQINEDVGRKFFDGQRLGNEWYDVYQDAIRIKERT